MSTHRADGPPRVRRLQPSWRRRLWLLAMIVMLIAVTASGLGRLPSWVPQVCLVIVLVEGLASRWPLFVAGMREAYAQLPRLDPDYRRRR